MTTENDILDHSQQSKAAFDDPNQLTRIRQEILAAVEVFLPELRAQCEREDRLDFLDTVREAYEELKRKPLAWFAEWHDWKRRGEYRGAAFVLKYVGRIGKGWA